MRVWIVALAASVAITGSAIAQTAAELQQELDQVRSELQAVQGRLGEVERGGGGGARQNLETLAGKVGIFDVGIGATVIGQGATHLSRNYTRLHENVVEAHGFGPSPVIRQAPRVDLSAVLDFELAANVTPDGMAYIHVEAAEGDSAERQINSLAGVNRSIRVNNPNGQLTMAELWYRHTFADMVSVTAGKINFRRMFDDNAASGEGRTLFFSPALTDNMTIGYPHGGLDLADRAYYADHRESPGVVVRAEFEGVEMLNRWYVMGGMADGNADYENVWRDAFWILEAGAELEVIPGLVGNYRGYAWRNNADHLDIRPGYGMRKYGHGIGVSFDQQLADPVTVFFRWGLRTDKVYIVDHAYSFGALYDGDLWNRSQDVVGIGVNVAMPGNRAKSAVRSVGYNASDESLIELFYNCQITEYLAVSPNVQYITNPGGKSGRSDITALGLRARVEF